MQKRSKIILIACLVILAYLVAIAIPIHNMSRPDFSQDEARDMLENVANAFMDENTGKLLSYAHPDVKLAEKQLKDIKVLLNQAFRNLSQPEVVISNLEYKRYGPSVDVDADVMVRDASAGDVYKRRVRFVIKRRGVPHFLGLMTVYEWKIASVAAPDVPDVP
jgi:hypothetical protein